jgi:lipid-A-disaccharide synthase
MSKNGSANLHAMIVAGETSGDALGADLMAELRAQMPDIMVTGVGGPKMAAQGMASIFSMEEIALMGLREILPRLPHLFKLLDDTVAHALAVEPDVLVLIDSPEFNHRLAARVKAQRPDIPVICFVAPQVWAWRRGRAKKMKAHFDAVLALLPFEPDIFAAANGPPCHFVGHPIMQRLAGLPERTDILRRLKIKKHDKLLSVLPGSRMSEIKRLLPVFGNVVTRLSNNVEGLRVAVPVLPHTKEPIAAAVSNWPLRVDLIEGEADKMALFKASRAALASSGTATLELGLAGLPTVAAYDIGAVMGWLLMRVMQVPSAVLTNLILDAPIVPEFLQDRCRADLIYPALHNLLLDDAVNQQQRDALAHLPEALAVSGMPPAMRAAQICLQMAAQKG